MKNSTATTCSSQPTMTVKDIEDAIKLIKSMPVDPIITLMESKGLDPKKGDVLVIPKSMEKYFRGNYGLPYYVKSSILVGEPYLVKNPIGWTYP